MKSLKEERLDRGLTQEQMAALCGVSLSAYRLWEYGVPPAEDNKKKLEEVLRHAPRQTDRV